jgi:lysophospholipase L1-like esterase
MTVILLVSVFDSSGGDSSRQDIIETKPHYQENTKMLKILALGDSYTVGEGLQRAESWPIQLAEQLRKDKLEVDTPLIIAATGWATTDLLRAIARSNLNPPYDIVTLLIGVNDQFQGFSKDTYATRFEKLLLSAVDFAGGESRRVIVISIPDYSVTPFGKRFGPARVKAAIDSFNEINKKLAEDKGVQYVNVTEISRKAAKDTTLLASDGLHPSSKMYAEWVRLIAPLLESALETAKHR